MPVRGGLILMAEGSTGTGASAGVPVWSEGSTARTPATKSAIIGDEALVRMIAADARREESGFKVVEVARADEALTIF